VNQFSLDAFLSATAEVYNEAARRPTQFDP
jgi:hypothetical protein